MAGEIQFGGRSGDTLYALLWDGTGQVYNGTAFETYSAASWADYDTSLVEKGASGIYAGTMPTVSSGSYSITIHDQAGGSTAEGDRVIGSGEVEWSGSALVSRDSRSTVTTAQVNSEVVDALTVDTISELAQAAPPATPTMAEAVMALYMGLRNKLTVTSTEKGLHNDAGTKVFKKALTDDGTTYTESESVSGA